MARTGGHGPEGTPTAPTRLAGMAISTNRAGHAAGWRPARGWLRLREKGERPLALRCVAVPVEVYAWREHPVHGAVVRSGMEQRDRDRALARLLPRIHTRAGRPEAAEAWTAFEQRLDTHFDALLEVLLGLYGGHFDFFYHLEELLVTAAAAWLDRPAELRALDATRE